MNIKMLIKKLSKLNENAEVLVASDEEGNYFHYLGDIYSPPDLKYFEYDGINLCDSEEINDEGDAEDGYLTTKDYNKYKNCIVIFPK